MATNKAQPMTTKRYFRGDEVRITGPVEIIHGGLFWPAQFKEGHRKGQSLHIPVLAGEIE